LDALISPWNVLYAAEIGSLVPGGWQQAFGVTTASASLSI
jgi:hypothetical protein